MFGFLKKLFGGGSKKEETPKTNTSTVKATTTTTSTTNKTSTTADHSLDCKSLNCPMPIVNISKQMKLLTVGQTLEVTATDPAFKADLEAWVRKTGNELVSFVDDTIKVAIIKKTQE